MLNIISGGVFTGLYLVILGIYFYKEPFKFVLCEEDI